MGGTTAPTPRMRREIVSYSRRDGRQRRRNRQAWDGSHARYLISPPRADRATSIAAGWRFAADQAFGRDADLVIEVGSGTGEALVAGAQQDRHRNYLGVDIYRPGLARTVIAAAALELDNLRVLEADAVPLLGFALPEASVSEIRVFFPDPWPKVRHHKRRLVNAEMLAASARVLTSGGLLRLATDWPDYAQQMRRLGAECPNLTSTDTAQHDLPARAAHPARVTTRYERKAHAAGRPTWELTFVRRNRDDLLDVERREGDAQRRAHRPSGWE